MAREWHTALGHLPLEALKRAAAKHIRTSKFWPTPAEIGDLAIAEAKDLREAMQWALDDARPLRLPDAQDIPFKPDEAAMSRVTEMLRAFKARNAEVITDRMDEWEPSDKGGASEALKASKLVRGMLEEDA